MTTIETITAAINACGAVFTFLALVGVLTGGNTQKKLSRCYLVLAALTLSGCLIEFSLMLWFRDAAGVTARLQQTLIYLDYAFGGVIRCAFAFYICEYIGMKISISRNPLRVVLVLESALLTLVTAAWFLPVPGWLNALGLSMLLPFVSAAVSVGMAVRHMKLLRARELISLLLYVLITAASYAAEAAFPGLWAAYFGSAVAMFIIYVNIQSELGQRLKEQEHELAASRTAITLSQIQPHFIINTLLNVESLCHDAGNIQAENIMRNLTDYLGGNLRALTEKEPIAFVKELEHTKQYLSIAQVRFEDKLRVEFDIRETDFKLPALTVQPLVENAVWHGICNRENGGTVTVRTEKTPDSYRVIIADNGVGFDPAATIQDSRPHIGIENVRHRIETICGGSLTIDSTPGVGTNAVLTIPRGDSSEHHSR